jgi:hypothetical protein
MGMQRAGHRQCNKEVVSHVDGGKKKDKQDATAVITQVQ